MVTTLSFFSLKRICLHIVEDSEAVDTGALEISIVDIANGHYLLLSFLLTCDLQVMPIKYLNPAVFQSDDNMAFVTKGVENLVLRFHLLP